MKKQEYIDMLIQENVDEKTKALFDDVIDCVDIALSQESDDFEVVDTSLGLSQLYKLIEKFAKDNKRQCVGPFETAEMFSKVLGANFVRASLRTKKNSNEVFELEDLI